MDTPPPPAADISVKRPRPRTTVYAVMLAGLAGVLMFWELGADALTSDEAQYALVVQNIRDSGNWLDLTPYPPTPYFQKPPLYFWLTASTYRALGGSEFGFRAWSAAAGVGAVVLTCILGAMLFSPEIGALGAVLLLLNRSFLLLHGARSGTFDSLVTFLVLAAIVAYVVGVLGKRRWTGWILVGVFAGLASITKPFVGVPLVALLAVHALFTKRDVLGPLLALLALFVVASPWYLVEWSKYHDQFTDEMFRQNVVQRIAIGVDDRHVRDVGYYLQQISKSSPEFFLGVPAMAWAIVASVRGERRASYGLLSIVGVGWVVLFTLSASKAVHYIYPAFPLIAVMLAAGALSATSAVSRKLSPAVQLRVGLPLLLTLGVAFTFQYSRTLFHSIPADRSPHVPWEMCKILDPAIRAGDVRVVFCGFPAGQTEWRSQLNLRARDCYYLTRMRPDVQTANYDELAKLLGDRKPTLAVLAGNGGGGAFLSRPELAGRLDERFVYPGQGYQFVGIDLDSLLGPTSGKYVRIEPDDAAGTLKLTLSPAVRAAASIRVRLRIGAGGPTLVRYTFNMAGDRKPVEDHFARVRDGIIDATALADGDMWPQTVTLTLRSADPPTQEPVTSTVDDVRLTMLPLIPIETHPRR